MTEAAKPSPSKSWQHRIGADQHPLAVDFVESITVDWRLYKYDIAGSIAHATMLQKQGLISQQDLRDIKRGLKEIASEIEAGSLSLEKQYEDIHMVIEAELVRRIGEPGKKLHTGRSRNDQVALDVRLWTRDQAETLIERIIVLQTALVRLAGSKQGRIIMPAYTHLQRAQPVLVGHYLLAFVEMLERDRQRFQDALARINVSPLGAGAAAGTSLPLDRAFTAGELGFAEMTRNSLDAVSDRDYCIEFAFAASLTGIHLSRLAEDWILFASQEFHFLTVGDAFCTGSSMMPQKRNPDMLELIRGKASTMIGHLTALLTMVKALPMTYNRDLQEDKKHLFAIADTLGPSLQIAAELVRQSRFDDQAIAGQLDAGFSDATALAEYLVTRGVPFRQAHGIVGQLVSLAEGEQKTLSQLSLETFREYCDRVDTDVYAHIGVENVVARYQVEGAAGHRQLDQQLAHWAGLLD